jgi:biopolymer transport protein ExbB/TolQ
MLDHVIIQTLMHAGRVLVSFTMTVLALFSIYSLSVMGERWWMFRQSRRASAGVLNQILACVDQGDFEDALLLCERRKEGHVAPVLAAGLREFQPLASRNPGLHGGPAIDRAVSSAREAMQRVTDAEIGRLEHRLTSLATLGNISPFVGLFGTVIGVMRAFEAISRTGSGGLGTVSAGIAEALVATAAGLFVAIPAVTAYNHFVSRVKACASEMDGAASALLLQAQRVAVKESVGLPVGT